VDKFKGHVTLNEDEYQKYVWLKFRINIVLELEYHNSPSVFWLHAYRGRDRLLDSSRDHDLDLGLGHTSYCHASFIDRYLRIKFCCSRKNFLHVQT